MLKYKTIQDASEEWNLTVRHIQAMCKEGKIPGVQKYGRAWMIPASAKKPIDGRTKVAKELKDKEKVFPTQPLIRKSPFLGMTDLYTVPGSADRCVEKLSDCAESQTLFELEIAYSRGEIDKVYKYAKDLLKVHTGFYAMISVGMILCLCAMWKGDAKLWREARRHICEAPCKNDNDRDILTLSLACVDTAIRDMSDYPDWFTRGCFENLPPDAHPSAKVFYIKYLLVYAQELAKGEYILPDVTGLGLIKTFPYIVEPIIAQAVIDRTVVPEIYCRLIVAIAYHQIGDDERAIFHVDKAIALDLPDNLLGILAEHRRQFDSLLDERLKLADADAYKKYIALHKTLLEGWTKLHNVQLNKRVSARLSTREREIARLAAFKLSDKEIAARLNLSIHTVKGTITSIIDKTGAASRSEFGLFI